MRVLHLLLHLALNPRGDHVFTCSLVRKRSTVRICSTAPQEKLIMGFSYFFTITNPTQDTIERNGLFW